MDQSSLGKSSFLHWTVFEMHRTEASKVRAYTVLKPSSILKCHHLWQKIVKLHITLTEKKQLLVGNKKQKRNRKKLKEGDLLSSIPRHKYKEQFRKGRKRNSVSVVAFVFASFASPVSFEYFFSAHVHLFVYLRCSTVACLQEKRL